MLSSTKIKDNTDLTYLNQKDNNDNGDSINNNQFNNSTNSSNLLQLQPTGKLIKSTINDLKIQLNNFDENVQSSLSTKTTTKTTTRMISVTNSILIATNKSTSSSNSIINKKNKLIIKSSSSPSPSSSSPSNSTLNSPNDVSSSSSSSSSTNKRNKKTNDINIIDYSPPKKLTHLQQQENNIIIDSSTNLNIFNFEQNNETNNSSGRLSDMNELECIKELTKLSSTTNKTKNSKAINLLIEESFLKANNNNDDLFKIVKKIEKDNNDDEDILKQATSSSSLSPAIFSSIILNSKERKNNQEDDQNSFNNRNENNNQSSSLINLSPTELVITKLCNINKPTLSTKSSKNNSIENFDLNDQELSNNQNSIGIISNRIQHLFTPDSLESSISSCVSDLDLANDKKITEVENFSLNLDPSKSSTSLTTNNNTHTSNENNIKIKLSIDFASHSSSEIKANDVEDQEIFHINNNQLNNNKQLSASTPSLGKIYTSQETSLLLDKIRKINQLQEKLNFINNKIKSIDIMSDNSSNRNSTPTSYYCLNSILNQEEELKDFIKNENDSKEIEGINTTTTTTNNNNNNNNVIENEMDIFHKKKQDEIGYYINPNYCEDDEETNELFTNVKKKINDNDNSNQVNNNLDEEINQEEDQELANRQRALSYRLINNQTRLGIRKNHIREEDELSDDQEINEDEDEDEDEDDDNDNDYEEIYYNTHEENQNYLDSIDHSNEYYSKAFNNRINSFSHVLCNNDANKNSEEYNKTALTSVSKGRRHRGRHEDYDAIYDCDAENYLEERECEDKKEDVDDDDDDDDSDDLLFNPSNFYHNSGLNTHFKQAQPVHKKFASTGFLFHRFGGYLAPIEELSEESQIINEAMNINIDNNNNNHLDNETLNANNSVTQSLTANEINTSLKGSTSCFNLNSYNAIEKSHIQDDLKSINNDHNIFNNNYLNINQYDPSICSHKTINSSNNNNNLELALNIKNYNFSAGVEKYIEFYFSFLNIC